MKICLCTKYYHCLTFLNTFSVFQASDKYFTFETEQIIVSVGSPGMTQAIFLKRKSRQTLLIPSVISNEWLLVSDNEFKDTQEDF